MIQDLENYLNKKEISTQKISLKIINQVNRENRPVIGILNTTILIDERIYSILNKEELKSLCLHEIYHLRASVPDNSFSLNLNLFFYISFFIFGILLSLVQIKDSRRKANQARIIELECDEYAIKENGKENFLTMMKKIERIEKDFFSLDDFCSQFIFGKFHPSFKERISQAS